jgi:hypothetical protein
MYSGILLLQIELSEFDLHSYLPVHDLLGGVTLRSLLHRLLQLVPFLLDARVFLVDLGQRLLLLCRGMPALLSEFIGELVDGSLDLFLSSE